MSPQIVNEFEYTFKTDIWSLGCLYFELLTGKPPFQSKNMKQLEKHMTAGKMLLRLKERPSLESLHFLSICLLTEEEERASIGDLVEHPFLNMKHSLSFCEEAYFITLNEIT